MRRHSQTVKRGSTVEAEADACARSSAFHPPSSVLASPEIPCRPVGIPYDAAFTAFGKEPPVMRHVISALVMNEPGVLANVAGMFAARGFNIDSLVVGRTEDPKLSRMTIVCV